MLTQLFKGVAPLLIDPEILAVMKKKADHGLGGPTRGIAILNDAGQLYRVIGADGPMEAMNVVEALRDDLGLFDRVGWSNDLLSDVDTLTGRKISTNWSAVLQVGRTPHPIPAVPRLDLKHI